MGAIPNATPPGPMSPGRWIGKIIVAVILGEAIWGLLVSLTSGLIVPGLARVMGGDAQSPVYLGKGDFNLTGIFVSILELCLAGIVAILLNQWSSGSTRGRVRTVKVRTVTAKGSIPSIAPAAQTAVSANAPKNQAVEPEHAPAASAAAAVAGPPSPLPAPPSPIAATEARPPAEKPPAPAAKAAAPPKQEKPKKPAEVYYNLVGEPINPTEDDD